MSQAELQFTSLSHDETCDRAQLSLRRAEPQISDHLQEASDQRLKLRFATHSHTHAQNLEAFRLICVTKPKKRKEKYKIRQAAKAYLYRIILFLFLLWYRSTSPRLMLLPLQAPQAEI